MTMLMEIYILFKNGEKYLAILGIYPFDIGIGYCKSFLVLNLAQ